MSYTAKVSEQAIEKNPNEPVFHQAFAVAGKDNGITCVPFGTPHGVVLVDDAENMDVENRSGLSRDGGL